MNWLYYLLQFTWGLPMNIIGALAYILLHVILRYPTYWRRNMLCIQIPPRFGGMNLGMFCVFGTDCYDVLNHEYGHSIQNMWWGFLMPFVIGIPSMIRYWYRELVVRMGRPLKTAYDDIWFEGQATALGNDAEMGEWSWL